MLTRACCGLLMILLTSATACSVSRESRSDAGTSGLPGNNSPSGVVLSGPALQEHGGTLLAFLFGRVSGLAVDYSTYPCPSVQIRGRKSLYGSNDPIVYVDGARAVNSCVLEMLSTRDISHVEVYPMGVSHRPGYEAHPNGLILVFLHDGPSTDRPEGKSRVGFSAAE